MKYLFLTLALSIASLTSFTQVTEGDRSEMLHHVDSLLNKRAKLYNSIEVLVTASDIEALSWFTEANYPDSEDAWLTYRSLYLKSQINCDNLDFTEDDLSTFENCVKWEVTSNVETLDMALRCLGDIDRERFKSAWRVIDDHFNIYVEEYLEENLTNVQAASFECYKTDGTRESVTALFARDLKGNLVMVKVI